ncbi:VOC family protein [Lapillicoccus jejuensis]|uniref:Putative enzyme related to lactoylglutathione lyase n=1 Tax=Lapillicoccus jejuensis TaxID=402171 RepID=A0A542E131_9MICO|nr:VOC family protein [Lapillicoccus jejuensis]TQJ09060.1 putative enzyme related to lactoylglutathione lyase [Lapillicoccus jejuensis]
MLGSPIHRHVGQVFIPVRDLHRAAQWYGDLLSIDPGPASHDDTILDLPVQDGPGLALDATRPEFTADGPPRFFFWADDLEAVVDHLQRMGTRVTSDVLDIGSVSLVQFEDPDGNALMVCRRSA